MLRLFAWNSQGAKWDALWTNWLFPALGTNDDVAGVLTEAGWAPWVLSGDVQINATYQFDSRFNWFDHNAVGNSAFCAGIGAQRGRYSLWVPWVGNLNAMKTNSRCSLGGAFLLKHYNVRSIETFHTDISIRPVVRFSFGVRDDVKFVVLVVHLISGYARRAQEELDLLTSSMRNLIPATASGIIVGDMNINLQTTNVVAPNNWRILNTGVPTQQSGGELDWGLLYDPNHLYGGATVTMVQQYKTPPNQSDHSILRYNIPLPT